MLRLLTGGARSGKSRLAVRLAAAHSGPVTFIATAEPGDDEMAIRIAAHQAERPDGWTTVEEPIDLSHALSAAPPDATTIIDCLTLWIANLLGQDLSDDQILDLARSAAGTAAERPGFVVAITNEVGGGIVPANPVARRYRDLLGDVNRIWAEHSTDTHLVVAGRLIPTLDPTGLTFD